MRKLTLLVILIASFFLLSNASAQSIHVKVPLTVSDALNHRTTVYFGVDQAATVCIDPELGEFELPADRCGSAGICAYFADPPYDTSDCFGNGLLLDLRPYTLPIQVDLYSLDFSTSTYPVTIYWPKLLGANYDSIIVRDAITGTAVYANMVTAESLVISNPTIQRVIIAATGPRGFLDAVNDRVLVPAQTTLCQNYPNPFNPSTQITYTLSTGSRVLLDVFNIVGREVAMLIDKEQSPGIYTVDWKPQGIPSGVYYYRLTTGSGSLTRPMILLK